MRKSMFLSIILLFIGGVFPARIFAGFTRTYGEEYYDEIGKDVVRTDDGGYIAVGYAERDSVSQQVYIMRTDSVGNVVWSKTYGGSREDIGYSIRRTPDGGYVIVGATRSFGAGGYDVYLIKIEPTIGDLLWAKTLGGPSNDYGRHVEVTPDGGFIIAGYTSSYGAGMEDVYLVKTDSLGNMLWYKTYGGDTTDMGMCVDITSDGGYFITGYTSSFGVNRDRVYLIKTDSAGDTLWTRIYGEGYGTAHGFSGMETDDGGYIVAGGDYGMFLLKTDFNGDSLWMRDYPPPDDYISGYAVKETNDGGYIIAGSSYTLGLGSVAYLLETDALGYEIGSKRIYASVYAGAKSVIQVDDSNFAIAGYSSDQDHFSNLLLAETGVVLIDENNNEKKNGILSCKTFGGDISIEYTVSKNTEVDVSMYDTEGRLVRVIDKGMKNKGKHTLKVANENLRRGVYIVNMRIGNKRIVKKLLVIN